MVVTYKAGNTEGAVSNVGRIVQEGAHTFTLHTFEWKFGCLQTSKIRIVDVKELRVEYVVS
jgi:hypothetical protein